MNDIHPNVGGISTRLVFKAKEHNFWPWINSGRTTPARPQVISRPLPPGTRLRATDRIYEIQSNGAYRRISAKGLKPIPFKESNLAVR